jgi:hypothetical protein
MNRLSNFKRQLIQTLSELKREENQGTYPKLLIFKRLIIDVKKIHFNRISHMNSIRSKIRPKPRSGISCAIRIGMVGITIGKAALHLIIRNL